MIQVSNIAVQKGEKLIIQNASFQILPGQISVLIGKNGAGKSTLLEALTKSNALSTGWIKWDQQLLSQLDSKALALRRAVLSQKVNISFSLKVEELVEIGAYVSPKALSKNSIASLVKEALSNVGMLDFIQRDFNSLSGGEQKRVLLAKCIVQLHACPWSRFNKYLFLDEPTSSLDIEQQYLFIDLVKRLVKQKNIGVFAVLHDINLAAQFADEIIMLRQGKVIEKGSPTAVLTAPKLQRTFDIRAIVKSHPVFGCPHITTLPQKESIISNTPSSTL